MTDSVIEFLEVAIHSILYYRRLYPDGIFKLMKKYGCPVHISQYSDLNEYIKESLKTVKKLLKVKKVKQVNICFFSKDGKLLETFVIQITDYICSNKQSSYKLCSFMNEIYKSMQDFLLALSTCNFQLKPLPEGSAFQLQLHTSEHAMMWLRKNNDFQNFPWIGYEKNDDDKRCDFKIVPLRTFTSSNINIEIFVRENADE
ncbi:DNA polymerase zeta subunit 2 isoform X2 [Lycorma delicatula]|uniref:DNA polymerase zeta subunit 2 isoform X2 n=1 Tax=Lycorma delicatula TaxID=130591 RepID=UPI003F515ED2